MKEKVVSSTPSSSSSCLQSSNWESLPDDQLVSIIDKLVQDDLFDYFRVSAVCKSWNSVALSHKEKLIPPQLPWLLNKSFSSSSSHYIHIDCEPKLSFYNFFMDSEVSNIMLPCKFEGKSCCGSSHGWLVFLENKLTYYFWTHSPAKRFVFPNFPEMKGKHYWVSLQLPIQF